MLISINSFKESDYIYVDGNGVDIVDIDKDDEEIDTLGGLVFLRTGRVPARGEIVPHESGVAFEVIDADPRRIKRLRLRLPGALAAPAALPPPAKD